jgi:2-aminoadipate transaminase
MGAARRLEVAQAAAHAGVPLVEDNPYGDLWFDAVPPPPLSAAAGESAIYLGSFSKVLAPGLRLGYVVAPPALCPKLLQAKQAADLHTPGFNQRVAHEVIRHGFLDTHLPQVRERYKAQRDAMRAALDKHLPTGCRFNVPAGGMFFWVELPEGLDAVALLPRAVEAGMAYVPGAPFYCHAPRQNTLRLSFVTVPPAQIDQGVAALGQVLRQALEKRP